MKISNGMKKIIILISAIFLIVPLLAQGTSLSVQILANPSYGEAPLNNVDFSFNISGSATGDIVYKIDCTSDGVLEKIETVTNNSFTAQDVCDYSSPGNYLVKIDVLRQGLQYQTSLPIVVIEGNGLSAQVSANPSSGDAPLNDVDVSISVSGTATGTINYKIDCRNDGTWEKEVSTTNTNYTAYDLCDYADSGTYSIKIKVEREGLAYETTLPIEVYSSSSDNHAPVANAGPDKEVYETESVVLQGSGYDPDGDSITYSWGCGGGNLSNSNIAQPIFYAPSVSQNTTYTCTLTVRDNQGLIDSDLMKVLVKERYSQETSILILKDGKNITRNQTWKETITAKPDDVLEFRIKVINQGDEDAKNLILKDSLPDKLTYLGELKVSYVSKSGNIISGIDLGKISPGKRRTVTFRAKVDSESNFGYGSTFLTNFATVSGENISTSSNIATVNVSKTKVAGAVTDISTGLTNNIFLDMFLLPLIFALILFWLFKSHIIKFEERIDNRKKEYQEYKSKKLLQFKIAKEKIKDSF